jgi:hypothetical protein
MRTSLLASLPALGLLTALAAGQTSYPMISHTHPVAVQRGKKSTVEVAGTQNFAGTYKALFQGPGIKAEGFPPLPAAGQLPRAPVRSVKMQLTVDPAAALGVRDFRLASTLGISSIGQLLVVDHPVLEEKGLNNTVAQAQAIQLPAVVCGKIEALEDVDCFRFRVEAGQTLTFEIRCARLQDRIHDLQKHADPMLTLYDASGRELAANDDCFFADPYLSYTFTKAGEYVIQVRDSNYDGDPRWVYALLVDSGPCVSHVFPLAGNPGQKLTVEPVGSASLLAREGTIELPREAGLHELPVLVKGQRTNPTAIVVSKLPQVMEKEPNDTTAQANRVQIPCGINGRMGVARDLDHFNFAAKKGTPLRFEVKARRFGTALQSGMDSSLDIMTPDGRVLASNDDANGKDSALVFTPPADGDYVVRIRDLHSGGGPHFVYYLEVDYAVPDFLLRCDPDKAMIGPGSSAAWYVHVTRVSGFSGPVKVTIEGLPADVTASPLTIPASQTTGVIVLTAGATAKRDAVNVQIVGEGTTRNTDGKEVTLRRTATPNQEIYFPGGGRGLFPVSLQTVCVTDPSDILKVEVQPAELKMKPGQTVTLNVNVVRRKDFDKGVTLDVMLRHLGTIYANPLPAGVTMTGGKTLLGTGNQGTIVLRVAPDAAPCDRVPICVLAHVSVNFVVKVSYASAPILLTIEK